MAIENHLVLCCDMKDMLKCKSFIANSCQSLISSNLILHEQGMDGKKRVEMLLRLESTNCFYVSCNPATAKQEIVALLAWKKYM